MGGPDNLAWLRMQGKAHRWQRADLCDLGGSALQVQGDLDGQRKVVAGKKDVGGPHFLCREEGHPKVFLPVQFQNDKPGRRAPGGPVSILYSFCVVSLPAFSLFFFHNYFWAPTLGMSV